MIPSLLFFLGGRGRGGYHLPNPLGWEEVGKRKTVWPRTSIKQESRSSSSHQGRWQDPTTKGMHDMGLKKKHSQLYQWSLYLTCDAEATERLSSKAPWGWGDGQLKANLIPIPRSFGISDLGILIQSYIQETPITEIKLSRTIREMGFRVRNWVEL